jgi:hypothetical protein
MRRKLSVVLILVTAITFTKMPTLARPALLPEKERIGVFPGPNRLKLAWTNQGLDRIDIEIKGRVFQESSTLAMELPIEIRGRLQLLPNQTAWMLLSAEIPDLRDKSLLLVRWEDGSRVLGKTELIVYSRDILHEFESMAGEKGLGVRSSDEEFKSAFAKAKVRFQDVADPERFDGQILITSDGSKGSFASLARRGIIVICVLAAAGADDHVLRPNFFAIPYGDGAVVFVRQEFIANFDTEARSQCRLVQICGMATQPGRPNLPVIFQKDFNEN